jgi:hypothetical protein
MALDGEGSLGLFERGGSPPRAVVSSPEPRVRGRLITAKRETGSDLGSLAWVGKRS